MPLTRAVAEVAEVANLTGRGPPPPEPCRGGTAAWPRLLNPPDSSSTAPKRRPRLSASDARWSTRRYASDAFRPPVAAGLDPYTERVGLRRRHADRLPGGSCSTPWRPASPGLGSHVIPAFPSAGAGRPNRPSPRSRHSTHSSRTANSARTEAGSFRSRSFASRAQRDATGHLKDGFLTSFVNVSDLRETLPYLWSSECVAGAEERHGPHRRLGLRLLRPRHARHA